MQRGNRDTTPTAADFPDGRWRARWIWSRPAPTSLTPTAEPLVDHDRARSVVLLRRSFDLTDAPARVVARLTADSRYVLWVNGRLVGRGPVRDHPQRLHYDTFDLAPVLRPGVNTVAVLARHYGLATPWWMPSSATFGLGGGSFLFEAALGDPFDATTPWIVSDETWRALEPGAWDALIGQGIGATVPEACDGRLVPAGWQDPGFADHEWRSAHLLATNYVGFGGDPHPPTHPYGALLPRPIPQLGGAARPGRITAVATAPDPLDEAALDADPVVQVGLDERHAAEHGTARTVDVTGDDACTIDLSARELAVVHVDFGEQVAGHVELRVDAPAGTRIEAKGAEALDAEGRLEALQQHSGFRYTCRGHDDTFETFDTIGLRHLALVIRGAGTTTIGSVTVHEHLFAGPAPDLSDPAAPSDAAGSSVSASGRSSAPSPATAGAGEQPWFACSDPLLDDIWRIGRRTVDLCSQDAYLDCSSREQRAWTGDSVVHQLVDLTSQLDWSLARHNVSVGAASRPDGMLPMAASGDFAWFDNTMIPDWALHWVHAVHNLYRYTGDRDLVAELLPVAERVLRWFLPFQGRDGLLDAVTGWVLLDWSAVSGEGRSATLNALWARGLQDFAEMAEWLGDTGRARWAAGRWAAVAEGFEQFWDPARGRYVDNIVDGTRGRATSQHGNATAVVAGLVPADRRVPVIDAILDPARVEHAAWLVPDRAATLEGAGDMYAGFSYLVGGYPEPWWDVDNGVVAAQPFYRYVVHDAVVAAGAADRIPALCRDWQVLIPRSATTWTEVWYGGSHCHGWCATPTRDLVQHTLGITPHTPGFATARIDPHLGDLTWARGAAPTPAGLLHVSVTADRLEIDSPVPVVVGHAELPAGAHVLDR